MKWKFVYNSSLAPARFGTIDKVAHLAQQAGYKFFSFNGWVHFIAKTGTMEETGIHVDELI